MADEALLIVGLGNPGSEYDGTRHNAGFMVVDRYCAKHGISLSQSKFQGIFGTSRQGGRTVVFLKPQTYMHLSGKSVVACMQFYHIECANILVIHDELDLPVGDLRVKQGGGSGGHNGLKSIINLTGHSDFNRMRIGIGRPEHGDVINYVLGRYPEGDLREKYMATLNIGVDALEKYIEQGAEASMRFCNGLYRAKKKEEAKGEQS